MHGTFKRVVDCVRGCFAGAELSGGGGVARGGVAARVSSSLKGRVSSPHLQHSFIRSVNRPLPSELGS